MPRTADPRRAKLHHPYTVEEAADTMGVHPNTVRAWIARGLPVLDERRPLLIRGADLRQFLTRQRRDRKRPTGPGRIFCLACRAPKVPAGGMVDFQPMANGSGNLAGLCPDCDRLIYRRVSERSLESVCAGLDVQRMPPAIDVTPCGLEATEGLGGRALQPDQSPRDGKPSAARKLLWRRGPTPPPAASAETAPFAPPPETRADPAATGGTGQSSAAQISPTLDDGKGVSDILPRPIPLYGGAAHEERDASLSTSAAGNSPSLHAATSAHSRLPMTLREP